MAGLTASKIKRGIADLLYSHQWDASETACDCGWRADEQDHVDHQADVLQAAFDIRTNPT